MNYIRFFDQITLADVPLVGGKNASLGELTRVLAAGDVRVPPGFAITADAYRLHLSEHHLTDQLKTLVATLGQKPTEEQVQCVGAEARQLIASKELPKTVADEVLQAYEMLSRLGQSEGWADVAVRSSATAEDLPNASFAGQHDSFLHITSPEALLNACVLCMASVFTDRALVYRREKGFDDFSVALSVGVQVMVRASEGASGVIFTLEPDSGSPNFVTVTSVYGLGESIVQGIVTPDEWLVHKETFSRGFRGIVRRILGSKAQKMVYPKGTQPEFRLQLESVSEAEQQRFSLSDEEIGALTRAALRVEEQYSKRVNRWMPLDIEWARDGSTQKLFIVQARPETVYGAKGSVRLAGQKRFVSQPPAESVVVRGRSVGTGIVSGTARLIKSPDEKHEFKKGDILVTDMTNPDWVSLMRDAGAIVTNRGGRTCHAAIVSRELGVIALVGTVSGTAEIRDGETITVECKTGSEGVVYRGSFATETLPEVKQMAKKRTWGGSLYVNVADPDEALRVAQLPVDGVGLARLEFIISSQIGVHPLACVHPERVTDQKTIDAITVRLGDQKRWADAYIERLAQSISCIAAAFYPRPVTVRCTDFKSNEYRDLLGGSLFEPAEENPMLGFRGAARYVNESYSAAFALECRALSQVRSIWGCTNMKILIPFVRSHAEAEAVLKKLDEHGLRRGGKGLEILMMIEIPQNVLAFEEYADLFDGFSIGSNDLTQLTLGVDRDSGLVSHLFEERSAAAKQLLFMAIEKAKKAQKPIGICGQAPSDFPDLAKELIAAGISSISLIPESAMTFES